MTNQKTFWNGEPCEARIVRVVIGPSLRPTWWCAKLEGAIREAVEVKYGDQTFYLDNEDGSGWRKVTEGMGSPGWGHASLPAASVVVDSVLFLALAFGSLDFLPGQIVGKLWMTAMAIVALSVWRRRLAV